MMVAQGARWAAVIGVASLAGCSWTGSIFTSDKVAYESAQSRAPLEVPPDLSQLPRDERFIVPDRPQTVTASGQIRPGAAPMAAAGSNVVPAGVVAKIERQGNQRWLAVDLPPDKVWPVLVDFFPSVGLSVERSDAAAGIVETVWAENRAKLPQDIIRRTLGRVLDSVYSTGEQDKFRARLERTAGGTSEIYVSHRGMIEVYTSGQQDRTAWQPRPSDPDLEAEMLQRLLVKFDASAARTTTAATAAPTAAPPSGAVPAAAVPQLARLVRGAEGRAERVELDESFDRAWRRVGLALDRGGFTVEDRDRAKGLYFVRYLDPDYEARQKADRGFFSRIFGRERAVAAPQFRVTLTRQADARTDVQVLDAEGKPERSATGERILTLLTEQLR
jgi:outer membrane protein assembly factor BamC